ncbi:MAG: hypothetical protein L6R38_003672 [Xanthoria sp. 2 TBL-2021]|nr:MAG: hypothetical protein L6R38_003672 [Xanthoria sp. 2 TBL-2021]
MYEHLRNDNTEFTFPDNVFLYCNPLEPSDEEPSVGMGQRKERKLSDFFQLPQRLGWNFQENGDRSLNSGTASLDIVTQRWLYFEVLAQVFGHLPDYRSYDFVKTDRSGVSYITTTDLPKYLERWLDSEKKSQANERRSRLIRIQQVLDKARWYVSQHCAVPSRKDKATWEINDLLALSFIILGETLTRALSLIQKKLGFRIEGWCSHDIRRQGWGYSKLILQKLDEDGWCAKAIHMLQAQLRGNSIGLVYLFTLRSSSSKGPDHEQCTATVCKEMEIRKIQNRSGPARYHYCASTTSDFCSELETGEKPPNCNTDADVSRSIDGQKLADIINRGNVPLLLYRRANRDLQVVEMNQSFDKSYAIFSHVWTDGFGSLDEKNGTSLCVLHMFSKMLEKVAVQRSGSKAAVPELFWIDTLAIPVEKKYATERRKAIKQMHHIYTHAKYTVVLDLSLMRTTVGLGYSNPAMKITMCRWMTRLWTLQEAVLSKHLFFCFKDRIIPMTQLEEMFPEEDSELQSCIPSLARTYYAGILGEVRPKIHEEFRKNEGWTAQSDFLALVWKAAQWRSTAHPIHETLSLATMLNQDTELFAQPAKSKEGTDEHQQECDDRMVELLSQFAAVSPCPIPPGMIFLPGPRLSKKAYGWAPRSWLSSHEIDSPDPLSLPYQGNTRLMTDGLEVQFPGFLLHDLGFNREELWMRREIYFPTDSTLLEWYRVIPAQDTTHFPKDQRFAGNDLAIIVSRMPVVDIKETALFVAVKRIHGGIRYAEILNRVWISRAENPETVREWSNKHREGHHDAMSAGERLPPTTKWCVDGPDLETMKTEEAKPTDSKGHSNGHSSDEEEPKPLERSRTTGFRNRVTQSSKVVRWLKGRALDR